jgi:hypothetical protein
MIMKNIVLAVLCAAVLAACGGSKTEGTSEVKDSVVATSKVFFQNLHDGDTVTSPVHIVFGVEGMTVQPAGEIVEGTGHHHVIVDGTFGEKDQVVPADSTHIHFGKGQTETDLPLKPGPHSLILQFANGIHQSYGQDMSAEVNIVVK